MTLSTQQPVAKMISRYQIVFGRLCQLTALNKNNKIQEAIDGAVITILALHEEFNVFDYNHICEALVNYFGVDLPMEEIQQSISRLRSKQRVNIISPTIGRLDPNERTRYHARVKTNNELAQKVREKWSQEIKVRCKDVEESSFDVLWSALNGYLAKVFCNHGAQTLSVLSVYSPSDGQFHTNALTLFNETLAQIGSTLPPAIVRDAFSLFFDGAVGERLDYLKHYLDGTWTFFALNAEDATAKFLEASTFPQLKVFVDTSFIFSILDLHDYPNPETPAAKELLEAVKQNSIAITFHYLPETLEEFKNKISSASYGLAKCKWTPEISRNIVRSGRVGGLALAYHKLNAETPTSPEIFLRAYDYPEQILGSLDFKIFRANVRPDQDQERWEMAGAYLKYLHERGVEREYNNCDHDMRALLTVREIRLKKASSFLEMGSVFLTCDRRLFAYDRNVLSTKNPVSFTILPSHMTQLVRPFVTRTADFDERFVKAITMSEFRSSSIDYQHTVELMASYMASFRQFPEEIGQGMMTNELLLARLKEKENEPDEFNLLLENELAETNVVLRKQTESKDQEIGILQQKLSDTQAEMSKVQAAMTDLSTQTNTLQKQYSEQINTNDATKAELAKVNGRLDQVKNIAKWSVPFITAVALTIGGFLIPWRKAPEGWLWLYGIAIVTIEGWAIGVPIRKPAQRVGWLGGLITAIGFVLAIISFLYPMFHTAPTDKSPAQTVLPGKATSPKPPTGKP